jgi:hypothetical protein
MEPEISHPQQPTTGRCPEALQSSPQPIILIPYDSL